MGAKDQSHGCHQPNSNAIGCQNYDIYKQNESIQFSTLCALNVAECKKEKDLASDNMQNKFKRISHVQAV